MIRKAGHKGLLYICGVLNGTNNFKSALFHMSNISGFEYRIFRCSNTCNGVIHGNMDFKVRNGCLHLTVCHE